LPQDIQPFPAQLFVKLVANIPEISYNRQADYKDVLFSGDNRFAFQYISLA
jgi:hypothetical protein